MGSNCGLDQERKESKKCHIILAYKMKNIIIGPGETLKLVLDRGKRPSTKEAKFLMNEQMDETMNKYLTSRQF